MKSGRLLFLFYLCFFGLSFAQTSLRDPTKPLESDSSVTNNALLNTDGSDLNIQGLFISKSRRVALIDDTFYTVGEMTKHGSLVAIFKDRIVVKQGQKMRVVFMSNEKVRQDK